jgi:hypothetical protein
MTVSVSQVGDARAGLATGVGWSGGRTRTSRPAISNFRHAGEHREKAPKTKIEFGNAFFSFFFCFSVLKRTTATRAAAEADEAEAARPSDFDLNFDLLLFRLVVDMYVAVQPVPLEMTSTLSVLVVVVAVALLAKRCCSRM